MRLTFQHTSLELHVYSLPNRNDIDLDYWLTADEKKLWEIKAHRRNRLGWISARIATKKGVIIWANEHFSKKIKPDNIVIFNKETGEPYIKWELNELPPQVSLSHHSCSGIAAISKHEIPVGCDIEKCAKLPSNILQYFTTVTERQSWYAALKGRLNEDSIHTLLWVIKESVIKCLYTVHRNTFFPYEIEAALMSTSNNFSEGSYLFTLNDFIGSGAWVQLDDVFISGCVLDSKVNT